MSKETAAQARRREAQQEFDAQRRAEYVEALQFEREGYVRRGLDDRVAQVDEQIKKFTDKPKAARTAPKRDTSAEAPEQR